MRVGEIWRYYNGTDHEIMKIYTGPLCDDNIYDIVVVRAIINPPSFDPEWNRVYFVKYFKKVY